MDTGLITVVPFSTPERFSELKVALDTLPYNINVIWPEDWARLTQAELGSALVVFISEEQASNLELCQYFDELGGLPKLCILDGISGFKQRRIIDRCHDVMTWPCSAEEISYRFCRMLENNTQSVGEKSLDAELKQAFIQMNFIGESPVFSQALSRIQKAAKYDVSVLLMGETGTGKELAARAIHYMGGRNAQPFIPVNCGALPEEIFENELFGHSQGAYTDAKKNQLGLVAQAEGGTLFLDEIDSLSLKSQVALLRFLQDHQYRPLGSQGYVKANVRLLAATNADLAELAQAGTFREDLFYRLNIMQVTMPALRERTDDLPLLTDHLIKRFMLEHGGEDKHLSAGCYAWMRQYLWPGNVRELENVLLRAFLETEGSAILLSPPAQWIEENESINISGVNWDVDYNQAKSLVVGAFEKNYLMHVLSKADGNVSRAARLAGKERRSLGKLIKKHGLR
ncbi:sigma-54 interaction domain-containing protein [Neptunomonas japonica]|uniref:Fis family transcriptional regulator n=1 Tax=Neptunomonas japonica JAMM 1380 TaxID=1441457 RepID=A0A7R6PFW3_9GAMM|nr:sigma-54 dependent transcriptional regulator [Neptunomonas japonica]BBB29392.1 Fis family transcriptional regulator [Neptunomonas japonica JAMM 1380]